MCNLLQIQIAVASPCLVQVSGMFHISGENFMNRMPYHGTANGNNRNQSSAQSINPPYPVPVAEGGKGRLRRPFSKNGAISKSFSSP